MADGHWHVPSGAVIFLRATDAQDQVTHLIAFIVTYPLDAMTYNKALADAAS